MRKKSLTMLVTAIAASGLILSACSDPTKAPASNGSGGSDNSIVVGAANFPESEVVANLYAQALEHAGIKVTTKFNIGTREAYVGALQDGSIGLIPDYTGNLLLFLDKSATATSAEDITKALPAQLSPKGLEILTPAPAEDKDAVVVTSETASKWNLKSIEDIAAHGKDITFGAPPEFKERAVGLPGLAKNYNFVPANFTPISDGGGPATVKALLDGKIQAANIFTTSPDIPANNFVVLKDPKNNFPAQQVVPLVNKSAADKAGSKLPEVLNKLSALLTTDELIKLNTEVSGANKVEPKAAAQKWLQEKGLLG